MVWICWKWLQYMGNGSDMSENGFSIWEMAQICRKGLKYVGNNIEMWEMNYICENCL